MLISPKFLIAGLVVAGAIFVSFTVIRLGGLLVRNPAPPLATSTGPSGLEQGVVIPPNAFAPQATNGADSFLLLQNQIEGHVPPSIIAEAKKTTLPEIQKKVEAAIPPQAPKSQILELPVVADSELALDPLGVKTVDEYLKYFVDHRDQIDFDKKRFSAVLKNEYEVAVLPYQLVSKGIEDGNFAAVHDSLVVFREFIRSKIAYEKTIRVYGKGVGMNKRMIAFDMLVIDLISKALEVEQGKLSINELKTFQKKLETTALLENGQLLQVRGVITQINPVKKFLAKVAEFFGIGKTRAQIPTFGGIVGAIVPCLCADLDYTAIIAPYAPIPLVAIYVNTAWEASPALFGFRAIHPGALIIGTYSPTPIPCFNEAPPVGECLPWIFPFVGATPLIAGTGE